MKIPLQITFEDMPASEAIETKIRQRVARLTRFCPRIVRCQVWVLEPQRGHHRKPLHSVRIRLSLPEEVVVVNPLPSDDIFVAIRDSFDAARRQLEDAERRRRGQVKARAGADHATIARLLPEEGYGFLRAEGGRQIYFHRSAVRDAPFEALSVGMEVRFSEEAGDAGPKASAVAILPAARP